MTDTTSTDTKTCQSCNGDIAGGTHYIDVDNSTIHSDCFKCNLQGCGKNLAGNPYLKGSSADTLDAQGKAQEQGKYYCDECFEKKFHPECGHCKKHISGGTNFMTALGKKWHDTCFVCTKCDAKFVNNSYLVNDDSPYCNACHTEMFADKCGKCKKGIEGGIEVKQLSEKFHEDCFLCSNGGCALTDGYMTHEGNIYCPQHYKEAALDKCPTCNKLIEGGAIQAGQAKYHPACLKCAGACGSPATVGLKGEFFCAACGDKKRKEGKTAQ